MAALTKLVITLPCSHATHEADNLLALLALHVAHGWEEQSLPTGEMRCIVYSTVPDVAEELAARVGAALPSAALARSKVEGLDWVEAWKEFFTPVEGGSHFLVLAPWMDEERARTTRIPVLIEPGNAFGTGHHATTALCLDAVSLLAAEGEIGPGMRFLDLGTGSGILGLACAGLGLSGEGLDIDGVAVENALKNRELNGVMPEDFMLRRGGVEDACGPYDLVLANILAAPLRDMAPAIAALPGPAGRRPLLVLSGLLETQVDSVEAAYGALGYARPRRLPQGEWMALLFAG